MRAAILATFVLMSAPAHAWVDSAHAWIDCDSKAGRLVVDYGWHEVERATAQRADHVVAFASLLEILVGENEVFVDGEHQATVRCHLRDDELVVRLRPAIATQDLLWGRCGAAIGGWIDIARGDERIVTDLRFEDQDCTRLERYVKRVTVRTGSSLPQIEWDDYE